MDISNIPQNLIKALEQKNTDQLVALSRVLNLVLGKTVMATVTATASITPQEREQLLQQTAAALAQLNKQIASDKLTPTQLTPAIKAELSRLLQQQQLIQSPELKWVNLVVNGKPLVTFSDRPLISGQSVPVQLQTPQKLVLLDLPAAESEQLTTVKNNPLGAMDITALTPDSSKQVLNDLVKNVLQQIAQKSSLNSSTSNPSNASPLVDATQNNPVEPEINGSLTASRQLAPSTGNLAAAKELALKFSNTAIAPSSSAATATTKALIADNLRNLLPHKDVPAILFSAVNQLQQLPTASRSLLVSPSVAQALQTLAEQIRSVEQLAQPKTIFQILKNSGLFFENKLSHMNYANTTTSTLSNTASGNIARVYTQDAKGSLLTLLNRVTQELTGTAKPLSSDQTLQLLQQLTPFSETIKPADLFSNTKLDPALGIAALMQQLLNKPVKELSNQELRTQLLILLQQHSLHSLAKIQLQQLHSLTQDIDTKDSATPAASWQLDIPVKHQQHLQHLHLRIDREWIDEKNDSEDYKPSTKIKQWSVTLRFDLPTLGEFCAQLAIVKTQISATLWVEREKTFTQVSAQIDGLRKQLEDEGIQVNYLQCARGVPPQKPMALSYSLIDIST